MHDLKITFYLPQNTWISELRIEFKKSVNVKSEEQIYFVTIEGEYLERFLLEKQNKKGVTKF